MLSKQKFIINPLSNRDSWYEDYKECAVSIYTNNYDSFKKHIIAFNHYGLTGIMTFDEYFVTLHNIFLLLCLFCENDGMIKIFNNDYSDMMDYNKQSHYLPNKNYLAFVIQRPDKPLDIIKYLIEICRIDTQCVDNQMNHNCLQLMIRYYDCQYCTSNLGVVKYMIDFMKMDTKIIDSYRQDLLTLACMNSKSDYMLINILNNNYYQMDKYFIQALYKYKDIKKYSYITTYCKIIHYIINLINVSDIETVDNFIFNNLKYDKKKIKYILNGIHDNDKLNQILHKFLDAIKESNLHYIYDLTNNISKIIKKIFLKKHNKLSDRCLKFAGIQDIEVKYSDFVKQFDPCVSGCDMFYIHDYKISGSISVLKNLNDEKKLENTVNQKAVKANEPIINSWNHSIKPELLFFYNSIPFYGQRKIVYQFMDFFHDNEFVKEGGAEITGDMAPYLINVYLNQNFSQNVDLSQIPSDHIFSFIRFIDQYPSSILCIDLIELNLIEYFDTNSMWYLIDQSIQDIFKKYGLKYVHQHLQCKKIKHLIF